MTGTVGCQEYRREMTVKCPLSWCLHFSEEADKEMNKYVMSGGDKCYEED